MYNSYYTLPNNKMIVDYIAEYNLGFFYGNAAKYICRAGRKTKSALEDLTKAKIYIDDSIVYQSVPNGVLNVEFSSGHPLDFILDMIINHRDPVAISMLIETEIERCKTLDNTSESLQ